METEILEKDDNYKSKKPNHVRKLNFGQQILTLDVVKQTHGQKDGVLSIDRNVLTIPCTVKNEFVRNWIETHRNRVPDSDESPQTSPILGSSVTKHAEKSPVFHTHRKRARQKYTLNNKFIDNTERMCLKNAENQINTKILNVSAENNKCIEKSSMDRKESIKRNLFNVENSRNRIKEGNTTTSPILDRSCYSYKRRKRKFTDENSQRKALDRIDNKCTKVSAVSSPSLTKAHNVEISPVLDRYSYSYKKKRRKLREMNLQETDFDKVGNSYTDTNMNNVLLRCLVDPQCLKNKYKIMSSQKRLMLLRKLENSSQNDNAESMASKSTKIPEDSIESDSPVSEVRLNIEDSPKDTKGMVKMEIESSNEDSDNPVGLVNSGSSKSLSNCIEDANTQDTIPIVEIFNHNLMDNLSTCASKFVPNHSQTSTKDSDRTFFLEADKFRSKLPSIYPSQKISQISSQINDLTDNNSSETGVMITTEESPQRPTLLDPSMCLNILDSGKKKRKAKRGSLSEKLQSLINGQISSVRIWKHQVKQAAKDSSSLACVTVHVQACVTRFSRQFLEGFATKDPFNLLPRKEENKFPRLIKIMTIPDIVGRIELKSTSTVQIFPPWEILDDKELILNVTYINIVSDNEKIDVEQERIRRNCVKQQIIKQFDCPCIIAGKMIFSCRNRFDKPNVIEKLFID